MATGDREADALHDGNVRKIIADVCNFTAVSTSRPQNFFQRADFGSAVLIYKFDFAFPRALGDGGRFPAGDDSGAQAGGTRHLQSRPVIRAESLDFAGRAVPAREQPDVAVGEHAIHVHQQHTNFFRARGNALVTFMFFAIEVDFALTFMKL